MFKNDSAICQSFSFPSFDFGEHSVKQSEFDVRLYLSCHENIVSKHQKSQRNRDQTFSFSFSLKCNEIVSSREHVAQHSSNGKISPSKSFLIDNLQCSTIKRPHYCYLCRTNFETTNQIHLHLIEHQYPNRDYQCTLCEDQLFEDANQLYQHMIQHGNKSRVYPCRECDLLFMFSMHLINHQYSHTDATVLPLGISKPNGSSTIKDEDRVSWKSFVDRTSNEKRNRSVIVN